MIHVNILLGVFFLPPPTVQGLLLSCLSDLENFGRDVSVITAPGDVLL